MIGINFPSLPSALTVFVVVFDTLSRMHVACATANCQLPQVGEAGGEGQKHKTGTTEITLSITDKNPTLIPE